MNMFILDYSPDTAAKLHHDKHVVKMILESAQILCTVHHKHGDETPYKATHRHHPCVLWAGESKQNYLWLWELAKALNDEYKYRFNHEENHKSWDAILSLPPIGNRLPSNDLTRFELCMPDIYKVNDAYGMPDEVQSYRNYYVGEKRILNHKLAKYTQRARPDWLDDTESLVTIANLRMAYDVV